MNSREAHTGVTIAFTDIDKALMELIGVTDTLLDLTYRQGDRYLNVYKMSYSTAIHWVTYANYVGAEPLVTTTEEVIQFLFEAEIYS